MARAMILCAGYGTRLRPLTDELPKPLVPLGDRPILGHIAARLAAAGFDEAVVNTHHMPALFQSTIESLPIKLQLVHEPEILGTAGGIAGAREVLRPGPVLVWNGDILADPPIDALLDAVRGGGACLGVAPREWGEGSVGLAADGGVARLRGRTFGVEDRGGDYIGVAALGADVLEALPDRGCLVGDYLLPRLRRGESVHTVPVERGWSDAGDVETYLDLNLGWLGADDSNGSFVGDGARVSPGIELRRSVVGAGAVVEGDGVLEDSVVWPGAAASAPARRIIVTSGGRIVPA